MTHSSTLKTNAPNEFSSSASEIVAVPVDSEVATVTPFAFPRKTDDAARAANILVVDDELSIVAAVKRHLNGAGFRNVTTVSDPRTAIDTISETMPHLVLLDLFMKPVHGLEILEAIRGHDRTRLISVIVITASTDETIKITSLNLGANDFLIKPFVVSELVARVRNTLTAVAYREMAVSCSVQLESNLLHDELTGVANRRAFDFELKRRMKEWTRQRTPMGILMVSAHYAKTRHDLRDRELGEPVICSLAAELAETTRNMDLVARYSRDKFAVILPSTIHAEAKLASIHVQQHLKGQLQSIQGRDVGLRLSVGLAIPTTGDDSSLFVGRASDALEMAKHQDANCPYFHDGQSLVPVTPTIHRPPPTNPAELGTSRPREKPPEEAPIAIVDDDPTIIAVTRKHLSSAGFSHFLEITESREALKMIRSERPSLVILNMQLPHISGLDILKHLREGDQARPTPVLALTAETEKQVKINALRLGASDFLQKPVDPSELVARVQNALLTKSHLDQLAEHSGKLENEIRKRTLELTASRREAIQCLARAAELREDETGRHVVRVGRYAEIIAEELGFSPERVAWMELAAQLHDVGKIGVPHPNLHRPDAVSCSQDKVVREDGSLGTPISPDDARQSNAKADRHNELGTMLFDDCDSPIMRMAALVAYCHHEKWDGSGYPRGLAGEEIPLEARITAVADVFDALSTERPSQKAYPLQQCFVVLEENRDSHFDPNVLDAFLRRRSEIVKAFHQFAEVHGSDG